MRSRRIDPDVEILHELKQGLGRRRNVQQRAEGASCIEKHIRQQSQSLLALPEGNIEFELEQGPHKTALPISRVRYQHPRSVVGRLGSFRSARTTTQQIQTGH